MIYLYQMINLKLVLSALLIAGISDAAMAQDSSKKTTEKPPVVMQTAPNLPTPHTITTDNKQVYVTVEKEPQFPGSFGTYLSKNIKYPEADKIVGATGKVFIQFIVEKDGSISSVSSLRNAGSDLSVEAVRVIYASPNWFPGIQNGKPVRCQYTVPINFSLGNKPQKTSFKDLRKANYGFVFLVKDTIYSIDEMQAKLGDSFDPATVEMVKGFDDPKYAMPDKKAVYLIVMKG
jgi:periplasmic protein TonB